MTEQAVIDLVSSAAWVGIKIAAPALTAILVIGLVVSIFQAATQVSEQTLTFIPKILAMTAMLGIFGPWILRVLMGFTIDLIKNIPNYTH
jgi:flagellar biosynthetic protein FliQ